MEDKETKRKQKVAQALKEGKIKDDTTFQVFQMVTDLEERLDTEIPKIIDVIDRVKGDKGDSPTETELLNLIQPLIPDPLKPEDGKDFFLPDKKKKKFPSSIKFLFEKKKKKIFKKKKKV